MNAPAPHPRLERVSCIRLYTARLTEAERFYTALGLTRLAEVPGRGGRRAVLLAFPDGAAQLLLHDDPLMQFTDVEIAVEDVRATYQALKGDPGVVWLCLPERCGESWRASVRGPDGNVLWLVSRA